MASAPTQFDPDPVSLSNRPSPNLFPSPEGVHVKIGEGWKLLRWDHLKNFLLIPENTQHLPDDDVVKQTAVFLMNQENPDGPHRPKGDPSLSPEPEPSVPSSPSPADFDRNDFSEPPRSEPQETPKIVKEKVCAVKAIEEKRCAPKSIKEQRGKSAGRQLPERKMTANSDSNRFEPYAKSNKRDTEEHKKRQRKRSGCRGVKQGHQ